MRSEMTAEALGFSAALAFMNVIQRDALESQNVAGPWRSIDDNIVSTTAATVKYLTTWSLSKTLRRREAARQVEGVATFLEARLNRSAHTEDKSVLRAVFWKAILRNIRQSNEWDLSNSYLAIAIIAHDAVGPY